MAGGVNHAGARVGALSVTGLKADLPEPRIEGLGPAIRAHADQVSVLVGGRRHASIVESGSDGDGG